MNLYEQAKAECAFTKPMNFNYPTITTGEAVELVCTPKGTTETTLKYNDYTRLWDVVSKKETDNTMNERNHERDYLANRLREVGYGHEARLKKEFKMDMIEYPQTYKELIDWIKKGHYELDEKRCKYIDARLEHDDEDYLYYGGNCFDGIVWTARKRDTEGHAAAFKAMQDAKQSARDIIMTQDNAAGLEALQKFTEWTYDSKKKK